MDRISELPDDVLHSIMSLLRMHDAARMSVLSKRWKRAWDSFPVVYIDMDEDSRKRRHPYEDSRNEWIESMTRTFRRLRRNGVSQPRLEFVVAAVDPAMASALDAWMEMAVDGGVQELYLRIKSGGYALPRVIFTSRSLIALDLHDCGIDPSMVTGTAGNLPLRKLSLNRVSLDEAAIECLFDCFPSIEDLSIEDCYELSRLGIRKLGKLRALEVIGFCKISEISAPSLQRLNLEDVRVDDSILAGLAKGCPLLEDLELSYLVGLRRFDISGLPCLERVHFEFSSEVTKVIHIDAPSLKRFSFLGRRPMDLQAKLDIDACRQLKELDMQPVSIGNGHFLKGFISKLPLLEILRLTIYNAMKTIEILGPELRDIALRGRNLKDIKINAPQLSMFQYTGRFLVLSWCLHSALWESGLR